MNRLLAIALLLCTGCASLTTRIQCDWRSGPYACGPYPYAATAGVFDDCLLAPLRTFEIIADRHNDPVGNALCTLTWPFWVVDEVGEIVLDTAFLPVDSVYYFFFRKENQR
jgi:uncharacterized protein YceK